MEIVKTYTELFATGQIIHEGGISLRGLCFICLGEVDKVRAMRESVFSSAVRVVIAFGNELVSG